MTGWDDEGRKIEKGPGSAILVIAKWLVILLVVSFAIGGVSYVLGWWGEGGQVAQEQFGPRAAINKYNNLKSINTALSAKITDMQTQASSINLLAAQNKGIPRNQWARSDLETYNIRVTDLTALVMSYNSLAAEYNWKMASVNWAFANVGQLPKGADGPLPKDYRKYVYIDSNGTLQNTGISESAYDPGTDPIWT